MTIHTRCAFIFLRRAKIENFWIIFALKQALLSIFNVKKTLKLGCNVVCALACKIALTYHVANVRNELMITFCSLQMIMFCSILGPQNKIKYLFTTSLFKNSENKIIFHSLLGQPTPLGRKMTNKFRKGVFLEQLKNASLRKQH